MHRFLKDKEHLFRMAALFGVGLVLFVIAKAVLVPTGFGLYGHYRAGALADVQKRPVVFAGRAACLDCHTDEGEALKSGKHAKIGCEACHGALGRHAEDPSANKAVKPDLKTLCVTCHLTNVAKPKTFPQIDPKEHSEGQSCSNCHAPHAPDKGPKT